MKRYKHIPTGRIYESGENALTNRCYLNSEDGYEALPVPREIVESGSDWEEVKETSFTVLSIYYKPTGVKSLYFKEEYSTEKEWLDDFLSTKGWYIYSVKRNNDGEIFTIGDKCKASINKEAGNFEITSFAINTSGNEIIVIGINNMVHLNKLIRSTSIFTTMDGVDMFIGDTFYYIHPNFPNEVKTDDTRNLLYVKYLKKFSTKKLAEEYIIMNKPCLSINDTLAYREGIQVSLQKRDLVRIVKSRL